MSDSQHKGIWVFGDYRNYFQNRVTLQLLAEGKELARKLGTDVTALVLGDHIHQFAMEYVAHGADVVMVVDHPDLRNYQVETYVKVVARLVRTHRPEIFLAGATPFGREFFPRLAKRLNTGLSADCVALDIDPETGLLVQTTPSFGGELLAEVVTPQHRPQMATVHPGIFVSSPTTRRPWAASSIRRWPSSPTIGCRSCGAGPSRRARSAWRTRRSWWQEAGAWAPGLSFKSFSNWRSCWEGRWGQPGPRFDPAGRKRKGSWDRPERV